MTPCQRGKLKYMMLIVCVEIRLHQSLTASIIVKRHEYLSPTFDVREKEQPWEPADV